ncbi:MAG: hypothetical protein BWY06_03315 [Candidatus Latescibacteria bacterium ADurb.Bin168]|nr:MAG: hypothetical protein BWY06_03315 [Candidatus Latescibacteria bacterium ADurb.Bin168]
MEPFTRLPRMGHCDGVFPLEIFPTLTGGIRGLAHGAALPLSWGEEMQSWL